MGGKPGFRALSPYRWEVAGVCVQKIACIDQSPIQGIKWGELRLSAGGLCVFAKRSKGPTSADRSKRKLASESPLGGTCAQWLCSKHLHTCRAKASITS